MHDGRGSDFPVNSTMNHAWITKKVRWLMLVAAGAGILTGFLAPKPAAAQVISFTLELWPGGASTLTCGWHDGPCWDDDSLVVSGRSLDWASTATIVSKYRATMTTNVFFTRAGVAMATVGTQSRCSNVVTVDAFDVYQQFQSGDTYVHTKASIARGTTWNIAAGNGSWITSTRTLGTTANETGCSAWTGAHVHQRAGTGWTLRSYPDHSTCNQPSILTDCWVGAGYKQADRTWWISVP